MGADGGTIPKRCELVRNKKRTERIDKKVKDAHKWRNCQLTNEPLKKPIVACKLGRLYNKDAIIEAKLSKELAKNAVTAHIRTLADVKELRLTDNKDFKDNGPDKGDQYKDFNQTPFSCPITGLNMNGSTNFVVNWKCGCVFSERAMNEIKTELCHGCNGPLDKADLIVLNPDEETLKGYEERIVEELAAKKAKKAGKVAAIEANGEQKALPAIKAAPKRKAEAASIQDDPTASKALKSIFTSSEAAKNQPKSHWVTHNPLYF